MPAGVAVDASGAVIVADGSHRVLKLHPGDLGPTVLPFRDLNNPLGVAVDSEGAVYVADGGNNRVLKLAAEGDSSPKQLPFDGLNGPTGVAVDGLGAVYVTETAIGSASRVLKLPTE